MAEDLKLTQLPDAAPLTGNEYMYVVQDGAGKKVTTDQFAFEAETQNDLDGKANLTGGNILTGTQTVPSGSTLDVSAGTLTLADNQIAQASVNGLVSDLAVKQPLDSDLTAYADAADAAARRTLIGAGTGNGNALTSGKLSQFAATTSAELAGVISDETGTGALVFGTNPELASPMVGGILSVDEIHSVTADAVLAQFTAGEWNLTVTGTTSLDNGAITTNGLGSLNTSESIRAEGNIFTGEYYGITGGDVALLYYDGGLGRYALAESVSVPVAGSTGRISSSGGLVETTFLFDGSAGFVNKATNADNIWNGSDYVPAYDLFDGSSGWSLDSTALRNDDDSARIQYESGAWRVVGGNFDVGGGAVQLSTSGSILVTDGYVANNYNTLNGSGLDIPVGTIMVGGVDKPVHVIGYTGGSVTFQGDDGFQYTCVAVQTPNP